MAAHWVNLTAAFGTSPFAVDTTSLVGAASAPSSSSPSAPAGAARQSALAVHGAEALLAALLRTGADLLLLPTHATASLLWTSSSSPPSSSSCPTLPDSAAAAAAAALRHMDAAPFPLAASRGVTRVAELPRGAQRPAFVLANDQVSFGSTRHALVDGLAVHRAAVAAHLLDRPAAAAAWQPAAAVAADADGGNVVKTREDVFARLAGVDNVDAAAVERYLAVHGRLSGDMDVRLAVLDAMEGEAPREIAASEARVSLALADVIPRLFTSEWQLWADLWDGRLWEWTARAAAGDAKTWLPAEAKEALGDLPWLAKVRVEAAVAKETALPPLPRIPATMRACFPDVETEELPREEIRGPSSVGQALQRHFHSLAELDAPRNMQVERDSAYAATLAKFRERNDKIIAELPDAMPAHLKEERRKKEDKFARKRAAKTASRMTTNAANINQKMTDSLVVVDPVVIPKITGNRNNAPGNATASSTTGQGAARTRLKVDAQRATKNMDAFTKFLKKKDATGTIKCATTKVDWSDAKNDADLMADALIVVLMGTVDSRSKADFARFAFKTKPGFVMHLDSNRSRALADAAAVAGLPVAAFAADPTAEEMEELVAFLFTAPMAERHLRPPGVDDQRLSFKPDQWQKNLLDIVDRGESALVCAPTSSGKTFISVYWMERILRASDDGVVVFVAPSKALARQVWLDAQARFRKQYNDGSRTMVGMFTRDQREAVTTCQILVTVPDCLEILLLSPQDTAWPKRVKVLIVDEIHNISSDSGMVWERLLLQINAPVLGLSATLGNSVDFCNWLRDSEQAKGRECHLVNHPFRFNDLQYTVYDPRDSGLRRLHPVWSVAKRGLDNDGRMPSLVGGNVPSLTPEDTWDLSLALGRESTESKIDAVRFFTYRFAEEEHPASRIFCMTMDDSRAFANHVLEKLQEIAPDAALRAVWAVAGEALETLELVDDVLAEEEQDGDETAAAAAEPAEEAEEDELTTRDEELLGLLQHLRQTKMLPAIVFVLTRSGIEEMAMAVTSVVHGAYEGRLVEYADELAALKAEIEAIEARDPSKMKKAEKDEAIRIKAECKGEMDRILNVGPHDALCDEPISIDELKSTYRLRYDEENPLHVALRFGIGAHHAGLDTAYRRVVEILFRKKKLGVVFATSTLAQGIQAPCRTVVVTGNDFHMTPITFAQMCGRAGRRGFDDRGNVVIWRMPTPKLLSLWDSPLPSMKGNAVLTPSYLLSVFIRKMAPWLVGERSTKKTPAIEAAPAAAAEAADEDSDSGGAWDDSSDDEDEKAVAKAPAAAAAAATDASGADCEVIEVEDNDEDGIGQMLTHVMRHTLLARSTNESHEVEQSNAVLAIAMMCDAGLVDRNGLPTALALIVSRLHYIEPANFFLASLLESSELREIVAGWEDIGDDEKFANQLLSEEGGRREVDLEIEPMSLTNETILEKLLYLLAPLLHPRRERANSKRSVLPSQPSLARHAAVEHARALGFAQRHVAGIVARSEHIQPSAVLPLSGLDLGKYQTLPSSIVAAPVRMGGKAPPADVRELFASLRPGVALSAEMLPTWTYDAQAPLNDFLPAYVLRHRSMKVVMRDHGLGNDAWNVLHDVKLALYTVAVAAVSGMDAAVSQPLQVLARRVALAMAGAK